MTPDLERSFALEADFGTEGYRGVLLQPDEAGRLWPVGCCSKLKGDEYHWSTLEGVLYTNRYCLCKFADSLWFCIGVEIRTVVPGVDTAIASDNLRV